MCFCGKRNDDGLGNPIPETVYCIDCPPQLCNSCGEMSSIKESCKCWVSLEDMNLADQKALFALMNMGLTKLDE
jgi:hypothetical protein